LFVETKIAKMLGVDISTSGFKMAVRGRPDELDFESLPIQGGTQVLGQPAFCLDHLAGLFKQALESLGKRGWSFHSPGQLSWSFRQHDMTLVGASGEAVLSSLTWECAAAEKEVLQLQQQGAEAKVGKIEARFILPKLMWVLEQLPQLKSQVKHVLTSGDFVAWQLTGQMRLSTSDAVSNALLNQQTKELAEDVIRSVNLPVEWFPPVIGSGQLIGVVSPRVGGVDIWTPVRELLANWAVYAGLGDNHAAALGSGLSDPSMMVISAGSSGTVTRMTTLDRTLRGQAVCFEYFRDRLLLRMLHRCSLWYDSFLLANGLADRHEENNAAVLDCDLRQVVRVTEQQGPPEWPQFSPSLKIACTQFSIAFELLLLVKQMLLEVRGGETECQQFVLTGGLTGSALFRAVLLAGLQLLAPGKRVTMSSRSGPTAFQNATMGGLLNATLGGDISSNPQILDELCPRTEVSGLDDQRQAIITNLLRQERLV